MKLGLEGKVVVITGGSKGIGRAICQGFLEEGAIVHFCGRDEKALFAAHEYFAALQEAPKTARADGRKIDVTVPHEIDAWINDIFEIEKRIDIVVSNVSSISVTNDAAAWQTAYQTDMMGTVALINSALPYLEKSKGSIVTISSVSGRDVDFTAPSPYGALKAALTHALAAKSIRANTVSPGNIYIADGVWGSIEKDNPELFKSQMGKNPMGRMGKASEVADAVVWVASERAGFVSGGNLVVDGALCNGVQF
ncbi:related to SPS19-peroxisomal 2,4-dienoyl-CoA reductase [Phialocephala subalpina]|uniref:Related to SPS19-peroxisomal 2,4-dienoyl-CoA reductase n=1 Tax=Phialocephala subalpina TaxID=576137 RepID=A0A1L7WLK5_9HELO|nr:related to SPS19-peroxisomal 2,4-dienoyl-CoA reductase [Phialocephala subalpina]